MKPFKTSLEIPVFELYNTCKYGESYNSEVLIQIFPLVWQKLRPNHINMCLVLHVYTSHVPDSSKTKWRAPDCWYVFYLESAPCLKPYYYYFFGRIFCVIRNHPPGKPQDRKASSVASCTEGQKARVPFQVPPKCMLKFLHQRHGNNINGLLHLTATMSWMFTAYIGIFVYFSSQ